MITGYRTRNNRKMLADYGCRVQPINSMTLKHCKKLTWISGNDSRRLWGIVVFSALSVK
jgi:hypothetical protein